MRGFLSRNPLFLLPEVRILVQTFCDNKDNSIGLFSKEEKHMLTILLALLLTPVFIFFGVLFILAGKYK